MRIRNRQIPLQISSVSPLSDPAAAALLLRRPVQLLRPTSDSPSLEQQHDIIAHHHHHTTRDIKVFDAQTSNGVLPQSSSNSPQVMEEWCEREKAFPLKKRRGSFKRPSDNEEDEHQIITTTVKTMMINNKSTLPQKQKQQEHQSKLPGLNLPGKKKSRGGALMQGSGCSRVNGRGWRCCQQTLVGYSLCEHHLGKGRLRSMNSVRNRSLAATAPKSIVVVEKEDEKKPTPSTPSPLTVTSKKRMKLGVVKARSMSSLLGQPDCMMAAPPPPPLPPTLQDDNID